MDIIVLGLFLLATFLGAVVSGVAGFGMGVVFVGMWAHILTPIQTATLIVGYGLVTQSYGIWKLRRALSWRRLAPFIIGGAVGAPIGAFLLTYIDPTYLRPAVGVLLVLYSIYGLARPAFEPVQVGVTADTGIGVLNGLLGGLTGLVGIIVTIWCQLRGWSKDEQRTVFQPVMVAASALTAVFLSIAGVVTAETIKLYLLGLPLLLAGVWIGFKLYGTLDDAVFRKVLLALLLVGLTADRRCRGGTSASFFWLQPFAMVPKTAMSPFGTSRHFVPAQQFSRFRSEPDIQRAGLTEPDL